MVGAKESRSLKNNRSYCSFRPLFYSYLFYKMPRRHNVGCNVLYLASALHGKIASRCCPLSFVPPSTRHFSAKTILNLLIRPRHYSFIHSRVTTMQNKVIYGVCIRVHSARAGLMKSAFMNIWVWFELLSWKYSTFPTNRCFVKKVSI